VPAFNRLKSVGAAHFAMAAAPSRPETPFHDSYAIVGTFADQDAVERMKSDKANVVVGVFADPKIEATPAYCLAGPVGTYKTVMKALDVPSLRAAVLTGRKVRIAIVDTGISGSHTRLGYSSQGPGDLADRKPDVAAYSHFAGSGVYQADGGTSASCPVAAGVVAALRQKWPKITPAAMKGIVQMSTKTGPSAWSYDLGFGILNAKLALTQVQPPKPAVLEKKARGLKKYGDAWMLAKNSPDAIRAYVAKNLAPSARAASPTRKRKRRPGTK